MGYDAEVALLDKDEAFGSRHPGFQIQGPKFSLCSQ